VGEPTTQLAPTRPTPVQEAEGSAASAEKWLRDARQRVCVFRREPILQALVLPRFAPRPVADMLPILFRRDPSNWSRCKPRKRELGELVHAEKHRLVAWHPGATFGGQQRNLRLLHWSRPGRRPVESSVPPLEPPSQRQQLSRQLQLPDPQSTNFLRCPCPSMATSTYEPPTARERKILRRRERKSRSRSRSPISGPILWTLFMLVICVAVGWPFRQKLSIYSCISRSSSRKKALRQPDTNPSVAAPDAPPPPATTEATSGADAVAKEADRNAAATSVNAGATSTAPAPTTADPKLVPPAVVATRRVAPKVSLPSQFGLDTKSFRSAGSPRGFAFLRSRIPPPSEPQRVMHARHESQLRNQPRPRPRPSPAHRVPRRGPIPYLHPAPAAIRPYDRRSSLSQVRVTGSISKNSSASAPLVSQQPSTVRSNSFEARNSNPSNSAE